MLNDHDDSELKNKIKDWWNKNPFTYLMDKPSQVDWAFFRNIDRKIIKWMPWAQKGYPLLSSLIDYSKLKGKDILDIAIGSGWTTEQFIRMGAANVTGIDLTSQAIEFTKRRLDVFDLSADLKVADAESLPFSENSFDYVLAWGCLMHTPNTQKAIDEIFRVLKPGGKAGAMMYNKDSLHWAYFIWFGKGILKLKLLKMNEQELANRFTDGADIGGNMLTKFYSPSEIRKKFSKFFKIKVEVYDAPSFINTFPHRWLPLGRLFPVFIKQKLARAWGQTLWIEVEK
ncbi:class I SAM-dependent methyltransferase [Patescibacteria group bacterium]|nr:class I SAM-dependent methyltransferase [Patescibacteria group bacterium]MBU1921726.1 class I SAM-dependent methyltransferase [Patescibacteria group bacterium]